MMENCNVVEESMELKTVIISKGRRGGLMLFLNMRGSKAITGEPQKNVYRILTD